MAPVHSPPPPPSDSVVPLTPTLPPHISSAYPSPLLPRPARPWPHAPSSPPSSSPPISSSSDPEYPPLSTVPRRRRPSRRSWSTSPVEAPLASVEPPPSPSFSGIIDSGVLHPAISLSSSPLVDCAPAVASRAQDGPALLPAFSSLVVPSLVAGLPSLLSPKSEAGGLASPSNRRPYPVGASTNSSVLPSDLQFKTDCLETVEDSRSPLMPSSCKIESAGPLHQKHDFTGLLVLPSQHLSGSALPRTDDFYTAVDPASGSSGSSWASVVEKKAIGGMCPLKFFPPDISDLDNIILSPPPAFQSLAGTDGAGSPLVPLFFFVSKRSPPTFFPTASPVFTTILKPRSVLLPCLYREFFF